MALNIDKETIKLIQIIADDTFDFPKFAKYYSLKSCKSQINFLWLVLILTVKYPQIELYLKNLLNYFTVDELEYANDYWPILHYMSRYARKISFNAFVMVINCGININNKDKCNKPAIHVLFYKACDNHVNSILNLFIKHGAYLNILSDDNSSVLDVICRNQILDEHIKNCMMTLIDFGAKIGGEKRNNILYDFIEHYRHSSIKPAIKNENKI